MHPEAYNTFYKLDMTHWFPSGRRRILQQVIETLSPQPTSIADIGCGTGANLDMLAGFGSASGADSLRHLFPSIAVRGGIFILCPVCER
jgi:hypothetical protein